MSHKKFFVSLSQEDRDEISYWLITQENELSSLLHGDPTGLDPGEANQLTREIARIDRDLEALAEDALPFLVSDLKRWARELRLEQSPRCIMLVDRLKWHCKMAELRALKTGPIEAAV